MCIRGPAYSRRHSETLYLRYLGTYLCLLRLQSARPSCLESQIGNGANYLPVPTRLSVEMRKLGVSIHVDYKSIAVSVPHGLYPPWCCRENVI